MKELYLLYGTIYITLDQGKGTSLHIFEQVQHLYRHFEILLANDYTYMALDECYFTRYH